MKTVPTFEELFQLILQDYRNLDDGNGNPIDTSQGSITARDAAALASALQGAYYRARYVEGQALPNLPLSTDETVELWASFFGVYRADGESIASLLQRLLARVQQPPAGGNYQDWIDWAKSVTYDHGDFVEVVEEAKPIVGLRTGGSIDLFLVSDWSLVPYWEAKIYEVGNIVRYQEAGQDRLFEAKTATDTTAPVDGAMWELRGGCSSSLVDEVEEYIYWQGVLGIWDNEFHEAAIAPTDVTVRVDQIADIESALAELRGYVNSLAISQPLYLSVVTAIMVDYGAKVVEIDAPAGDVFPTEGHKIISGATSITVDAGL